MKKLLVTLLFLLSISAMGATQATPFVVTDFPAAIVHPDSSVWIKWTGKQMDSASIYFSRKPGGSNPANYEGKLVAKNSAFTNRGFLEHGIQFKPSSVAGMGTGIYYLMVASSDKNYSNEIKFIVKTTKTVQMISPIGQGITNVTPSFRWTQNPEVPYYHVIVTDEKINIGSNNSIEGLSVIWQAITADNQIVYGAPDPSGTITATPPPLSPGLSYSWFVLNNYGNNAALSAMDISLPGSFTLLVDTMKTPKLLTPVSGDTLSYTEFTEKPLKLRWTNLDAAKANTYKVYLYAASEDTALDAQLVLWDGEVTAGQFTGTDTAFVEIDARNILTSNTYTWKVIAVDATGKGQASKGGSFRYNGLSGGILAKTYERISTSFGIIDSQKVGLCEIKVEVLDGSMEKPLLFYTDQNGFIYRGRPVGTYRLTAVKDGYRTVTKTVTISEGDTARVDFFLERPEASIFGAVFDDANSPVNIAKITGVSTLGDTLKTETDPSGNFVLNCGKGDWDIFATKSGHISPVPTRVTVDYGESKSAGSNILLKRNSFILSGLVANSGGTPLVAARVLLKDEFGTVVGELPSTSSTGQYSFSVNPGTYTLSVTKTGFTSWSETFVFASSTVKNISLASGAAQIKGSIYGRNWSFDGKQTIAAIRNLTIRAFNTLGKEVASALTDVWGSFTLGVAGDGSNYKLVYDADGFIKDSSIVTKVDAGKTIEFPGDTLDGLANVYSYVYYSENAAAASEIQVSLLSAKDGETVARGKSDNTGIVELYKIPDGEYIVKAAGNNYFTDKIAMKPFTGLDIDSNRVTVKNGRLMIGTAPIQQIRIGVAEGKGAVVWTVNSTIDTARATVKILSPLVTSVKEGDTLVGIGLDTYRTEINMFDPRIVDCAKHLTVISENSVVKSDTITLPFWHIPTDSIQMKGETVTLSLQNDISKFTAGSIKKAELFYRTFGSTEFISDTAKNIGTDSSRFEITGVKSENVLEYYFQITLTNDDVYGYSKELYRSYMKADPKVLSRLEIVPQTDSTGITLAAGGSTRLELRGYFGDKFAPVGTIDAAYATWNATGVSLSAVAGEGAVVMLTGNASGTGNITVTFKGGTKYTLAKGVDSVVTIPVTTTSHPLSSIKISQLGGGNASYVLNATGAQFSVAGTDKSGTPVIVTPTWTWSPDSAGTVGADGKFMPAKRFIGRAQIAASVQDTIRDQLVLNDNSQAGIQVGYAIQASGDSLRLSDGYEMSIIVPDSSVAADNVILTVEHPEPRNTVKKAIHEEGISLVSRLYEIQRRSPSKFREDSLTVTVNGVPTTQTRSSRIEAALKVPEQYRSLLDATGSKFTVAVWNESKLLWQHGWTKKAETRASDTTDTLSAILKSVKWNSADSTFTLSVGEELNTNSVVRLAILLNEKENMEGDFQVSPNPFSPYVSPVNDYWFFGDTVKVDPEDMKGTCLKITPMNSTNGSNPNVTVNIYTANRSLVWEAQLNSVIPGKEYYLFWDGKTRIGRSGNADVITVRENTPIRPEGDAMCRNGRYFAVVVIDDGKEKKRFTKEIILFK